MKKKISSLSKRILFPGLTVCAAFCLTYITWNAVTFGDTVYFFSKSLLSIEAFKLLLICTAELILGSYIIDRLSQAD